MRVGVILEYDGTKFHGSQSQKTDRTVQDELEDGLERFFRTKIRVNLASRTDSGVHARGQVAAFDIATEKYDCDTIVQGLNYYLPEDLKVLKARKMSETFNPRHDAKLRIYSYRIKVSTIPPVIERGHTAYLKPPLEIEKMRAAASLFPGEHDFALFAGPATLPGATTIRRVQSCTVEFNDGKLRFEISANAFLHQQVRRMVGAIVEVGKGKLSLVKLSELIDNQAEKPWSTMVPSHGLVLEKIIYGSNKVDSALSERA